MRGDERREEKMRGREWKRREKRNKGMMRVENKDS
jgi:hypothetical protein